MFDVISMLLIVFLSSHAVSGIGSITSSTQRSRFHEWLLENVIVTTDCKTTADINNTNSSDVVQEEDPPAIRATSRDDDVTPAVPVEEDAASRDADVTPDVPAGSFAVEMDSSPPETPEYHEIPVSPISAVKNTPPPPPTTDESYQAALAALADNITDANIERYKHFRAIQLQEKEARAATANSQQTSHPSESPRSSAEKKSIQPKKKKRRK